MNFLEPKMSAKIVGTGSYVPERILTNEEIEQQVPGTNAAWTFSNLGVKERRIAEDKESTADLALQASQCALNNAGLSAKI